MEFVAAKCPNCAGELRLPDDQKRVKCMYCGYDVLVQEAINAAGVNPENLMKLAAAAEGANNHQEAYDYYTRVLEYEPSNHLALFGKAVAAGRLSTVVNNRLDELTNGIEAAIRNAGIEVRPQVEKKAAQLITDICANHEIEKFYEATRFIDCLKTAQAYDPKNPDILVGLINQCQTIILGNRGMIDLYTNFADGNEESLARYKGYSSEHHDWTSDIRRETNSLKQNIEELENEKESVSKVVE